MGVTVAWQNDAQNVLTWIFEDTWTWDDVFEAQDRVNVMLNSIAHTVDFITVFNDDAPLPRNAFTNYKVLYDRRHPNRGKLVMVGNTIYLQAMTASFSRLYDATDGNFAFAYSVEEACKLLKRAPISL